MVRILTLAALGCVLGFSAYADLQSFDAPTICGVAKIKVPEGWVVKSSKAGTNAPEGKPDPAAKYTWTWDIVPKTGHGFEVLITAGGAGQGGMKAVVENKLKRLQGTTVEKKLTRQDEKSLFYFSATDPAPKPGEFLIMTSGALEMRFHSLQFTIFHNSLEQKEKRQALDMIRDFVIVGSKLEGEPCEIASEKQLARTNQLPPGLKLAPDGQLLIQPGKAPFVLRITEKKYKLEQAKFNEAGDGAYYLFNGPLLPSLSLWIEPPGACASLDECSNKVSAELLPKKDLKQSTQGPFHIFEWMEYSDDGMIMPNIRAIAFRDGYWIDIHISMGSTTAAVEGNTKRVKDVLSQLEFLGN